MDVIGRIRAARASLRPAEQRVATAVLADPAGAVAATVSSLAERAEVSQATVVRFARALGFDGLPDLRIALTQDLARLDLELERSSIAHGRIDPASLGGSSLVVFNSLSLAAVSAWTGRSIVCHPPVDPRAYRTTPGERVTLINLAEEKGGFVFWKLARRLPP